MDEQIAMNAEVQSDEPVEEQVRKERQVRSEPSEIYMDEFDMQGFQVVRREFFSHTFEPSLVLKYNTIQLNTACIKKWPTVSYVQILINQEKKRLVVKPCNEEAKDAVRWCTLSVDKRKTREVKCPIFSGKLFDMLGWNTKCKYKLLGVHIRTGNESLFAFNLEDTEVYVPVPKENGPGTIMGRKAFYPDAWKDSFGVPVEEHDKQLQIDLLDGYARFEVVNKPKNTDESVVSTSGLTIEGIGTSSDDKKE